MRTTSRPAASSASASAPSAALPNGPPRAMAARGSKSRSSTSRIPSICVAYAVRPSAGPRSLPDGFSASSAGGKRRSRRKSHFGILEESVHLRKVDCLRSVPGGIHPDLIGRAAMDPEHPVYPAALLDLVGRRQVEKPAAGPDVMAVVQVRPCGIERTPVPASEETPYFVDPALVESLPHVRAQQAVYVLDRCLPRHALREVLRRLRLETEPYNPVLQPLEQDLPDEVRIGIPQRRQDRLPRARLRRQERFLDVRAHHGRRPPHRQSALLDLLEDRRGFDHPIERIVDQDRHEAELVVCPEEEVPSEALFRQRFYPGIPDRLLYPRDPAFRRIGSERFSNP